VSNRKREIERERERKQDRDRYSARVCVLCVIEKKSKERDERTLERESL